MVEGHIERRGPRTGEKQTQAEFQFPEGQSVDEHRGVEKLP